MFGYRLTENGQGMASTPQPNTQDSQDKLHSRPEDPETNTRPPGNGDRDEKDTERGREKLDSVLGQ
jgi:hypothetical protein